MRCEPGHGAATVCTKKGTSFCCPVERRYGEGLPPSPGCHFPAGCPSGCVIGGRDCTVVGAGFPKGAVEPPAFSKRSTELPAFLQNRPTKVHASDSNPVLPARAGPVPGGRCPLGVATSGLAIRTSRRDATRKCGRVISSLPGFPVRGRFLEAPA